jgi:phosphatidylglycerophosphate synthase
MAPGLAIIVPSGIACDRLSAQLTQLGVARTVALTDAASSLDENLRTVARLMREHDGPVVVTAGDIVTHTAALDSALIPGGSTTRVLVNRRQPPDGSRPVRVERDRLVSAGSSYHQVHAPNGALLDVLRVGADEREMTADQLDVLAGLVADGKLPGVTSGDVPALVTVALVRSGATVSSVDARTFGWHRVHDEQSAHAAEEALAAVDEDAVALQSAVKGDDAWFTTFLVSPYSKYIARWCARRGIQPNTVTVVSIFIGALSAAAFALGTRVGLIVGAVLLQLAFTTDCVDGQLARYTRSFSKVGAWLDATGDRAKEYVVYAGLAVGASRSGLGDVWPLAIAAMIVQVGRHMVDFAYAATHAPTVTQLSRRPLDDPDDGLAVHVAADDVVASGLGGRAVRLSRRMDARPWLRWGRKIIVLPIGERFVLIGLVAAVSNARIAFIALLAWSGFAAVYTTTGRILRSVASR